MYPVNDRCDPAGLHGRHSFRETVPAKEENADVAVFKERCDLSEGWTTLFDVPCRWHEEESHHRGSRQSPDDQKEGEFLFPSGWTCKTTTLRNVCLSVFFFFFNRRIPKRNFVFVIHALKFSSIKLSRFDRRNFVQRQFLRNSTLLLSSRFNSIMIWWRQLYFQVTREGELLPFFQTELKVGGDGEEDKIFFIWPTTIVHKIDEKSPLYHISASDMLRERFEIIVMLEGESRKYEAKGFRSIAWNKPLSD